MLVEFSLSSADGGIEVVVIEGWVNDFVAVVLQVGRFDAARNRVPAVKEEEFYEEASCLSSGTISTA